ncbi:MAG: hypothetical protein V4450_05115 [Bacteroidota bacterium]
MIEQKAAFLKNEVIPLLHTLESRQKGNWGKMDAQQMVEHLRDVCKVANGKIELSLINTDPAALEAARAFVMSESHFKENTRVPVMPSEPRAHKYGSMSEAIAKLEPELADVFAVYAANPSLTLMHPIFGALNYEEQIQYLDKHIRHHLRQFGLVD